MKKISIIILAALTLISCGKTYQAREVAMNNETDSVNHALGLLNGLQIKMYYLSNDSSDETIAEFIDALEAAYMGEEEELSEIAQSARQFAASIKGFETDGLADNKA